VSNRIQANYNDLTLVANTFVREAEAALRLIGQAQQFVDQLAGGAWVGRGAQAFYREMGEVVLPAANRLAKALQDASSATQRIAAAFQQAEEAAAQLFMGALETDLSPRPGETSAPGVLERDAGQRLANDFFDNKRAPYVINAAVPVMDHRFATGTADALKYSVKVGNQMIDILLPAQRDPRAGHFHSVDELAKGLSMLPEGIREHIKRIQVEPIRNPLDPTYAIRFKDPNFRTYMDAGPQGIIRVFPSAVPFGQAFLDTSLLHESGHIVSKRMWGTDPSRSRGWAEWEAAAKRDVFGVSVYGNKDIQEDFSEALVQYNIYKGTQHEGAARARWGNRFRILDSILG
jgi:WXG100 family type VII secretion target